MKKPIKIWHTLLPLGGVIFAIIAWLWFTVLKSHLLQDEWLGAGGITILLTGLFVLAVILTRRSQMALDRLELAVSERNQALTRSEATYHALVENIKAGILIMEYPGFRIIYANQEFKSILTINPKIEEQKINVFEYIPRPFFDGAVDFLKRNPTKHAFSDQIQLTTRRGEMMWSEVVYTPIFVQDVSVILIVMTDMTERRKSAETMQKRASELAALYAMSRSLAAEQDLTALLEEVADYAMTLLAAPCVEILLYDETMDILEVKVFRGFEGKIGYIMPIGRGVGGTVAQSMQSMMVEDYAKFYDPLPEYAAINTTSVLGVPMVYGGELIGVLELFELAPSTRKFTREDSRLLDMFAAQAASAVHNTWLLEKTKHHVAELEVVAQVSSILRTSQTIQEMLPRIMEDLLGLLKTSTALICLYQTSHHRIIASIAHGWLEKVEKEITNPEGVINNVLQTGQSIQVKDFATELEIPIEIMSEIPPNWSGGIMRLVAAPELSGIFIFAIPHPRELSRGDKQIIDTLSEIAGGAIHRAYLFGRTEQQLRRISALYDIDTVIRSSLNQRMILKILLEKVIIQLGVDAADILLCQHGGHTLKFQDGLRFHSEALEEMELETGQDFAGLAMQEERTIGVADISASGSLGMRSQLLLKEGFVSCYCAPLISKGEVIGVLEILNRSILNPDADWLEFLEALAAQAAIALDNAHLVENLQKSNQELLQAYESAIEGWVQALDMRDNETEDHSQRVSDMTVRLARMMGFAENMLIHVKRGALLHDIGKIGVPDRILHKPSALTPKEWVIMRKHPQNAYEMLADQKFLEQAIDIPFCHHEKWDGSGYPRGLTGEQIPLAARIFAVIDVWDALMSDRPYRKAWERERTLAYIQEQSGTHFDPVVVEAFMRFIHLQETKL